MKKFMAIVLSCVLALGMLSGCGDDSKEFKLYKLKTEKHITTLGQYKGLTVEAEPRTELQESDYEYLNQYMFAQFVNSSIPADYVAKDGDTLILDYTGKKDGVAFEGGTAEGTYLTLGSHTFIPGFEEGLVGIKVNETRDLNLTFPENYHNADLAGAEVVFTCTVHSIVPAYGEESIKMINNPNFSNVEEYKAYVKKYINDMLDEEYENAVISSALAQIEASTVVKSIPDDLLEEQKKAVIKTNEAASIQYSMSVDDILKAYGTTLDAEAEKFARRNMICQAIANIENITISDEKVNEEAAKFVADVDGMETVEDFFNEYGFEYYRNYLMCKEVYKIIVNEANVVAPKTEDEASQDGEN